MVAEDASARSPLSLEADRGDNDDSAISQEDDDVSSPPLDARVISVVKSCPDYTIRPARLATELGISVNDACAELCGLLSAVGGGYDGGSFRFESINETASSKSAQTMVFTFPPDFERRANRHRQREDLWKLCQEGLGVAVKAVKILTAFGLILSLFILCIAAMAVMIVAIIAMSRDNRGGHHRGVMMRQLRSLFITFRQLLWCYALMGPDMEGEHPFLREMAYDMALVSSLCCSSPASLWFWLRASQLRRRRNRIARGWGRHISGYYAMDSEVEGVTLLRRGDDDWRNNNNNNNNSTLQQQEDYRGLLSVAVEFLFGPSPFHPGPSESDRWKYRGAAIIHMLTTSAGGISLEPIFPLMDDPPKSLEETSKIISGGLPIVAHFNGIPAESKDDTDGSSSKARFLFPELMAESSHVGSRTMMTMMDDHDYDVSSWESLLYNDIDEHANILGGGGGGGRQALPPSSRTNPSYYLKEAPYKLTKLYKKQFLHCLFLGILNLLGVIWLRSSLEPGGMLEMPENYFGTTVIKHGLMKVLLFYALLFFALPGIRLLLILSLNYYREKRNSRRLFLLDTMTSS